MESFAASLSSLLPSSLATALTAWTVLALACFIAGELSGNLSQVDKVWSIGPALTLIWFAVAPPDGSRSSPPSPPRSADPTAALASVLATVAARPRAALLAAAGVAWGARLTYNFARRGGYDGVVRWRPWEGEEARERKRERKSHREKEREKVRETETQPHRDTFPSPSL